MRGRILLVSLALVVSGGCSVSKAVHQPKAKDLSVLNAGTSRDLVLVELGQPVVSEKDANGNQTDFFKFIQGQNGAAKAEDTREHGAGGRAGGRAEVLRAGHETKARVEPVLRDVCRQRFSQRGAVKIQLLADPCRNPISVLQRNLVDQNARTTLHHTEMNSHAGSFSQPPEAWLRLFPEPDPVQRQLRQRANSQADTILAGLRVSVDVTGSLERR